ncbi:reverse transcriptase domain-containing protein [Thermodesulfobacteriota bacterium]
MPGLDKKILDTIDPARVNERVMIDLRTDFILAPHYNAIFVNAGEEVWARVQELLRSGNYQPGMPHTISVPKERGFTRPGSILSPLDRFVYQALIDAVSPQIEQQLDRSRAFSHVLAHKNRGMFEPAHESWEKFQEKIAGLCETAGFIVKADIANYFDRIPQHHLINLMSAAKCAPEVVNLMEEMLLAFQERDSFGIIQGVFPSDVLGNFFLSDFDAYCDLHEIPSARYVDDIYLHFKTEIGAKKGLIELIERLRQNGLHLNEYKSGIRTTKEIIREETEVDELFQAAREEVRDDLVEDITSGYGFTAEWELEELEDPEEEDIQLAATERLHGAIDKYPDQSDKIEKFCLPLLRAAGSDSAVDSVLSGLIAKPHLTRLHHAYLSRFVVDNTDLVNSLELIAQADELVSDFQKMYILGSLFKAKAISKDTLNTALKWLSNPRIAEETRAMAAVFSAKHGNANQKRAVRLAYEREPSAYVRGAILYASRYLPAAEKKTCKKAWGAHSIVNSLIAQAM